MTRRVALALALALTTAATFAVVALGAQVGYFGFKGGDGTSRAEVLPGTPAAATVGAPIPEPTIITEYIYVDQTTQAQSSGFIAPRDGQRGRDDDDEWEWEHEDEHEHGHEREDDD